MACKDCINFNVCFMKNNYEEYCCIDFKDKNKFIELPCKIGDVVFIPWKWNGDYGIATPAIVDTHIFNNNDIDYLTNLDSDDDGFIETYSLFAKRSIGKSVFLTKEEAEKALREMKNDNT